MSTLIEFTPPSGDAIEIEFSAGAEFRGLAVDGTGPVPAAPLMSRSPGQRGVTALDLIVPARVVSVQFFSQYSSDAEYWEKRSRLSRALVPQPPVSYGESLELGRLRVSRDGAEVREADAIAKSTFLPIPRGTGKIAVDVEFLCPFPYWRESQDIVVVLEEGGGFEFASPTDDFPSSPGIEFPGNDVETEVINAGDVPAPLLIRLYGEVTTPRLLNVTTGETIEITGDVAAGDYVEINTAFGQKEVTLVESDGTRTSIMDRLNLDSADFWLLLPGTNTVRFEADVNVSGRAQLTWRQLYGGL